MLRWWVWCTPAAFLLHVISCHKIRTKTHYKMLLKSMYARLCLRHCLIAWVSFMCHFLSLLNHCWLTFVSLLYPFWIVWVCVCVSWMMSCVCVCCVWLLCVSSNLSGGAFYAQELTFDHNFTSRYMRFVWFVLGWCYCWKLIPLSSKTTVFAVLRSSALHNLASFWK